MATAVITVPNLGTEFDIGVVTANKVTVKEATTTLAGKVRKATNAEVTGAAAVNAYVTPDQVATISATPTGAAGGDLDGTYPNPTIAAAYTTAATAAAVTASIAAATVDLTDAFGVHVAYAFP